MIKFCPFCGTKIIAGHFCTGCGKDLSEFLSEEAAEQPQTNDLDFAEIAARAQAEADKKRVEEENRKKYRIEGTKIIEYLSNDSEVVIPDGITVIGEKAFYNKEMVSVTVPVSVILFEIHAFEGCQKLTKVNYLGDIADWCKIKVDYFDSNPLGFANNLYLNNVLVKDLIIPDGVLEIGDYVFQRGTSILSVSIADSVTQIGKSAFSGCSGIVNITLPDSVTQIGDGAFENCYRLTKIHIPSQLTSIGSYAFGHCGALTSIDIPYGVMFIGYGAFDGCASLTNVSVPDSLEALGDAVFADCNKLNFIREDNAIYLGNQSNPHVILIGVKSELTSFTIPQDVRVIYNAAFIRTEITHIDIPNSVRCICGCAFRYLHNLCISFSRNVKWLGSDCFSECKKVDYWGTATDWLKIKHNGCGRVNLYIQGNSIENLTIPSGIDEIPELSFANILNLQTVNISSGVKYIGKNAFFGCSLKEVTIPDSVTEIAEGAFLCCYALKEVIIPRNCKIATNDFGSFDRECKVIRR